MTDAKQALRERIWDDLEDSGVARFPFPPHGRIPNYAEAAEAAERLADQPEWAAAETIKANPDAPQLPVRRRALRDGKTVYMAVPRLADERCFYELDPAELTDYDAATTVSGVAEHATQVGPDAVAGIDLIVSGSVAVGPLASEPDAGPAARVGKGEGFSDLEYAILTELGLVDESTPVATTVHDRQLVSEPIAVGDHDVPMDLVVTPTALDRPTAGSRPAGIDWSLLSADRRAELPVLDRLAD